MWDPINLSGRSYLVTGGSSGIGRASAILLSQLNARLIVVGRDRARLAETSTMLNGTGHQLEAFDLSSFEDIQGWLKKVTSVSGPLDGLVHSAGSQKIRPLRFLKANDVEEMMRINVSAALGLAKAFRQKGVCTPRSSVVLLSSVMGLVGQVGQAAYSATKSALISLTKSLALELAPEGIRVNCVAPGVVKTDMLEKMQQSLTAEQFKAIEDMHPLGLGTPQDVAFAIAFLLSDMARWITGTTLVIDGGYTAH